MKVTLWGTRGSVASPGPDTARYGGNTACVQVCGSDGTLLVLDAGTGIRRLGGTIAPDVGRVDILLSHLHMDHIQGLGFFAPLRNPDAEVHIWGPASALLSLRARLTRYLSPPLFPVHLRELPCTLEFHEVPCGDEQIGELKISSMLVCHPDPTVGYRIESPDGVLTYIPDHEPALGVQNFPTRGEWTSGYKLAAGADILIHDAQYTDDEYRKRAGWGHSTMRQAFQFAALARAKLLVPFHHDPGHNDDFLDASISETSASAQWPFEVAPGSECATFEIG
jgi:ribonuclease BN (tRNA processing enzyme)